MRSLVLLLHFGLLVGFSTATVVGQSTTANSGSIYSGLGLGERMDFSSSQAAMMGGAGSAVRSTVYANLGNPALWSDQQLVRLSFGAQVQGLEAEDAGGQTARLTASNITALQISIPLFQDRLGAAVALRPYSRTNYNVLRTGQIFETQLPRDTINYRTTLAGDGGLHEAQLGFGWRLSRGVSVGVAGRAVFGVIENRQWTEYLPPNQFAETRVTGRTRMYGFGATAGAVATTTSLLTDGDQLTFSTALTLPTNLSTRRVQTVGLSLDVDTLQTTVRGSTSIPLSVISGVAYSPNARWLVAADVQYEPWSSFDSDFSFAGYSPGDAENSFADRLRVGGGVQLTPAGISRNAGLLARTAYRLGAYYDTGYVEVAGQSVATTALTGGFSIPGILPGSRFDLGVEVGSRGSTDPGLVRDLFIKGSAVINFGERWFIRRQLG